MNLNIALRLQKLLNIGEHPDHPEGYVVFSEDFEPGHGFPRPKLTMSPAQWETLGCPTRVIVSVEAMTEGVLIEA